MSDPLAEAIAMLKLKAVLTKTVTGAGSWRIRRSDEGLSFYCAVLEGGCRLELEGHDPLPLHAGDFILIPAAYHFALTSLVPPASPEVNTTPVEIADRHFRLGIRTLPRKCWRWSATACLNPPMRGCWSPCCRSLCLCAMNSGFRCWWDC